MKRLKVISGYTQDARFWEETGEHLGYIPRQHDIPSPYSYSPTEDVFVWKGRAVIHKETKHRRYEVFEIPSDMKIYRKEQEILDMM